MISEQPIGELADPPAWRWDSDLCILELAGGLRRIKLARGGWGIMTQLSKARRYSMSTAALAWDCNIAPWCVRERVYRIRIALAAAGIRPPELLLRTDVRHRKLCQGQPGVYSLADPYELAQVTAWREIVASWRLTDAKRRQLSDA